MNESEIGAFILTILMFASILLISYIYQLGEKAGRSKGFLDGWYFRHTKGDGDVPDDLLEKITPRLYTTDFGSLASSFGSRKKQLFLKWMTKENPTIGYGPKKSDTTFHEYAYANREIDLNWLLERIEQI